jgi:CheY-like chemotaxis protein
VTGISRPADGEPLAGRRILIVEDEAMIALLIEDVLTDLGSTVVGPASRVEEALEFARSAEIDLAALDLNLGGDPVYPVAEALAGRGIPFVFMTGYGQLGIAERWRGRPSIAKPFRPTQLASFLRDALKGHPPD